jgi:hypothetical protein
MRKLILALALIGMVSTASAHGYYRHGGGWIGPALIGGVIGYELSRPRYYEPPVVYVQPSPTVVYTQPQPTQYAPPPGYHYQQILDPNCNCYKIALVPN